MIERIDIMLDCDPCLWGNDCSDAEAKAYNAEEARRIEAFAREQWPSAELSVEVSRDTAGGDAYSVFPGGDDISTPESEDAEVTLARWSKENFHNIMEAVDSGVIKEKKDG